MKSWSTVNVNVFPAISTTVLVFAFQIVYRIKFLSLRHANASQDTSEIHLGYVLEPAHQTKVSSTGSVNATLDL